MAVPAAMEELLEQDAALGEAPGEDAVRGESPGLRESGPYSSKVDSGSSERSMSSGTEVCMRYAISYLRDAIMDLRVQGLLELGRVDPGDAIEHAPARVRIDPARVVQVEHRIACAAELDAWWRDGRKPRSTAARTRPAGCRCHARS